MSCDFRASAPSQGPVIQKDGRTYQLSDSLQVQVGTSNEVRVSSLAQVAGRQLRQTEWWVSREVIKRQPHWDGFSTEPPFSVQKACALALADIRQRFPSVHDWLVETVYLRNLFHGGTTGSMYSYPDIWVYEVTFLPADKDTRKKFEDDVGVQALTQVILLDGTLVSPREVK